ncbi:hypothetical protein V2J09_001935 [Rumex salicifolius]
MENQVQEHPFTMISDIYPILYTPQIPSQNEEAPKQKRRRRRKAKKDNDEGIKKRKLSEEQVNMLEMSFGSEHKLESKRKDRLASELGLDPRQVAVWFQNRRARWKTKTIEEEYSKLKASHDLALLQKCSLESQVIKLKEQLEEAQSDIRKLTERAEITSSNSPSSSTLTMDAVNVNVNSTVLQIGEYDFGGFNCGSPFYLHGGGCLPPAMDWGLYNV